MFLWGLQENGPGVLPFQAWGHDQEFLCQEIAKLLPSCRILILGLLVRKDFLQENWYGISKRGGRKGGTRKEGMKEGYVFYFTEGERRHRKGRDSAQQESSGRQPWGLFWGWNGVRSLYWGCCSERKEVGCGSSDSGFLSSWSVDWNIYGSCGLLRTSCINF